MSFLPKYASPCKLAENIPAAIAELLQADTDLKKRFREETITDLVVASLKALPIERLVVAVPQEKITGSDFDITVVADDRKDAIQFRLQAKRLSAHPTDWKTGSYKELAHPHNSGGQAATLIRSSANEKIPTIPLYAFYNPQGTIDQSNGAISGFELASGIAVSHLVREMVKAKPQRRPYKRVGFLKPLFFPLAKLLCEPFALEPENDDQRSTPRPEVFRRIINEAIDSRTTEIEDFVLEDLSFGLALPEPEIERLSRLTEEDSQTPPARMRKFRRMRSEVLPIYMERILDQAYDKRVVAAPIKRPKIILQSD